MNMTFSLLSLMMSSFCYLFNIPELSIEISNSYNIENYQVNTVDNLIDQSSIDQSSNSYEFSIDEFNDVEFVYKNIHPNDRVIFVTRHSERGPDYSKQWWLTEKWVEYAQNIGSLLRWKPFDSTSNDFYGSTNIKRTVETSYYIGYMRWNKNITNHELWDGDDWENYKYIYHSVDVLEDSYYWWRCSGEWFYENNKKFVSEKSEYLINELIELTEWHPFSWLTSHDCIMIPLIERITDLQISFRWNDRINFLSGIAIIVHPNNSWEAYPIRSLNEWKMVI